MRLWNQPNPAGCELDRAVGAWRRAKAPDARLSEPARSRLLAEAPKAYGPVGRHEPLRSLFLPTSRLALGAAVPLGALSALLAVVLVLQGGLMPGDPALGRPRIEATKVGSEVVFVIRNGDRAHLVSRSSDPERFAPDARVRTESGRFRDRLQEDSHIVYYRID